MKVKDKFSDKEIQKLRNNAIDKIRERDKIEELTVIHKVSDVIPSTGKHIFRFWTIKPEDINGPHYSIVLNEDSEIVELDSLSKREAVKFFVPEKSTVKIEDLIPVTVEPILPVTVTPASNSLVLDPGDNHHETLTVKVPRGSYIPKGDVYFLTDTTGSMSGVINNVQVGANSILSSLNSLGLNLAYGVGNYKDFPHDDYAFQHQLNPSTNHANAVSVINTWSASGGRDSPEAQFYALDQLAQPPGGSIGWRSGSKKIIVWIGDYPGHDPVCSAISGLGYDVTEASVINKLVKEGITVIAISTVPGAPNGLDDDPTSSAVDYSPTCTVSGNSGQASRIAKATGGVHQTNIDATNVVNTIINLVSSAVTSIGNLKLVPSGGTAPFVTSVTPFGGYGPLPSDREHTLPFQVEFTGVVPCSNHDQVFTGTIDVVADGVVVAKKVVTITVPACERYSYSVKFLCGVQKERDLGIRQGIYATDINIHNHHNDEVRVKKYIIPTIIRGNPIGREPRFAQCKAKDAITLPPNSVTMDDCHHIYELIFDETPTSAISMIAGFLEIRSSHDLNVTAVYTATDLESRSLSIDVEQIKGRKKDKVKRDE